MKKQLLFYLFQSCLHIYISFLSNSKHIQVRWTGQCKAHKCEFACDYVQFTVFTENELILNLFKFKTDIFIVLHRQRLSTNFAPASRPFLRLQLDGRGCFDLFPGIIIIKEVWKHCIVSRANIQISTKPASHTLYHIHHLWNPDSRTHVTWWPNLITVLRI